MSRKKTKRRHMTDEKFAELMKSAKQALAYERGEDSGHRVTRVAVPRPRVRCYPLTSRAYGTTEILSICFCSCVECQPEDCTGVGAGNKSAQRAKMLAYQEAASGLARREVRRFPDGPKCTSHGNWIRKLS